MPYTTERVSCEVNFGLHQMDVSLPIESQCGCNFSFRACWYSCMSVSICKNVGLSDEVSRCLRVRIMGTAISAYDSSLHLTKLPCALIYAALVGNSPQFPGAPRPRVASILGGDSIELPVDPRSIDFAIVYNRLRVRLAKVSDAGTASVSTSDGAHAVLRLHTRFS